MDLGRAVKGVLFGLALISGAVAGWTAVVFVGGILAIAVVVSGRSSLWLFLCLPLAIAGCLRVHGTRGVAFPEFTGNERVFVGSVASRPIENGRRSRFDLEAVTEPASPADSVKLCVSSPMLPAVELRDRVRLHGDIQRLDDVPEDYAAYLRSRGCSGALIASDVEIVDPGSGIWRSLDSVRRTLTEHIQRAAPGDAGVLLSGLVTGDDAALPAERRDDFVTTGTSHLTAVSGSNLALIVVILTFAGSAAGIARRWHWAVLVTAALWLYVGIVGPSPPPLRAAMVATLAVVAGLLGRKPDYVTLSVLVAALELCARPADVDSLAYRLSTVAALALVLSMSGHRKPGWRGAILLSVYATSATQAATSVFIIAAFGELPVYAVPANLLVAPLCAVAFPLSLLAGIAGVFSLSMASAIAAPAAFLADLVLAVVGAFADLPGARAEVPLGVLGHPVAWGIASLALIVALSPECRGGMRRVVEQAAAADLAVRMQVAAAGFGAACGVLVGLLAR